MGAVARSSTLARRTTIADAASAGHGQVMAMDVINHAVLDAFRKDLLNPAVMQRALAKLGSRLGTQPTDAPTKRLESEQRRLRTEIDRLTAALAAGGALTTLLEAI